LFFHNLIWPAWGSLRFRQLKYFGGWITAQVLVILLFLPQLTLAFRQVTGYANPNLQPPDFLYFVSRSWQAYTTGLATDPGTGQWGGLVFAGLLLVTWAIVLSTEKRSGRLLATMTFLLAWILVPLAAYFVVLQQRPSFEPRYLMIVTPAIFMLPAVGLGRLTFQPKDIQPTARILALVFSGVASFILLVGLYQYFNNSTFFKDDSAGVARWLANETTEEDIVYVDVPHPFHYYVDRFSIPAPTRYLFVDIHTAADTLNNEAADRDRLYWVSWHGSDTDPRGVIPFLAEKAGASAGWQEFNGYRVTWFELDADATFSLPTQLMPIDATFGDVIRLDGLAFGQTTTTDEPVWVTMHFSLLRDTTTDYRVSVRLRDETGQIITQQDQDLLNDRHARTGAWPLPDDALNQTTNVYLLPLPPETTPGRYQLEAVLYNAEPPYPSEGVSGQATSDGIAVNVGTVTLN
jgi:hypothetical protein